MRKSVTGNFFEDFSIGQRIRHATPRTVTTGDVALYTALHGSRFAVQSSDAFARAIGYSAAPVDDMLVFHVIFGKTVPDISRNAVANLGYAECRFLKTVYPGDTLYAVTDIIGLRENSSGKTGTVYVRTLGFNHNDEKVLECVRWVMVNKRDGKSPAPAPVLPSLAPALTPADLGAACPEIRTGHWNNDLAGSRHRFEDYVVGETIDHIDGMTVEEAEHQLATRLYQNTARVHFNQHTEQQGRFGRRLIYGGHVISLARALSFNGLANAFHISAINAGRHVAPLFAGGTVYAWSQISDKAALPGRSDVGALRIVTRATRDIASASFQLEDGAADKPGVILELDYWALVPRQI
jgi:2-methylfumaryl-CoA hydratase